MKDKPLYFLRRVIKQDGTVETYSPGSAEPVKIEKKPLEEPCPEPPPKPVYKQLTCKRCGRSWTPRSPKKPVQCPKCKSPYWNKNRVKKCYMLTLDLPGSF